MDEQVKLPSSSYEEVCKIIAGYARLDKETSLDEISRITGMHRTAVSGNNGFLTTVGIVEGGNRKTVTLLGRQLGLAIEHEQQDEIAQGWRGVIAANSFLRNLISSVRIRRGMEVSSLRAHVAYSAGLAKTRSVMTGTGTVIEILKIAGALREQDGKLVATNDIEPEVTIHSDIHPENILRPSSSTSSMSSADTIEVERRISIPVTASGVQPQIHVQINITCSAAELDDLGAKLRKLIRDISASQASTD